MRPRSILVAGALALVALTLLALVGFEPPGAEGSVLAREPGGWLGARRLLETAGAAVELLDGPLVPAGPTDPAGGDSVLALVFPWQHHRHENPLAAVETHLRRGGVVILAYSARRPAFEQWARLAELGLTQDKGRPEPPLWPLAWRRHAEEEWTLRGLPEALAGMAPRVTALSLVPKMPADGVALFQNEAGLPVAFEYPRFRGRVVVFPAELLSNARVGDPGNREWLAALAGSLPTRWAFDEYHHGLVAFDAPARSPGVEGFFDLYLGQLVLLYVLGILAVARRFGPPWREEPAMSGSVSTFLAELGTLHARLRHHEDAAEVLLERAARLDDRARLPRPPGRAETTAAFLERARRIGGLQQRRQDG